MSSKKQAAIINSIANGIDILQGVDAFSVIKDFLELLRVQQEEQTKRETIAAKRDALVAAIENQRLIIESYFEKRFAERKSALQNLFDLLRSGIQNKDTQTIDAALAGILGILQDSPLKDLEKFRMWYQNPNREELEF